MGIAPSIEAVQEQWRAAEVLHVDASGLRGEGKLHWLPVASPDTVTHAEVHAKRGHEAMDDAGIRGNSTGGTAVQDHWQPYVRQDGGRHALCNAHHPRALQCIDTQYRQPWANAIAQLLVATKAAVDGTPAPAVS